MAAFDNAEEFNALIDMLAERLRLRRQSDESVDLAEYISGTVLEPGHARKQRNARLLRHAITRGITISDATWAQLTSDLPPGVAVLHVKGDD